MFSTLLLAASVFVTPAEAQVTQWLTCVPWQCFQAEDALAEGELQAFLAWADADRACVFGGDPYACAAASDLDDCQYEAFVAHSYAIGATQRHSSDAYAAESWAAAAVGSCVAGYNDAVLSCLNYGNPWSCSAASYAGAAIGELIRGRELSGQCGDAYRPACDHDT